MSWCHGYLCDLYVINKLHLYSTTSMSKKFMSVECELSCKHQSATFMINAVKDRVGYGIFENRKVHWKQQDYYISFVPSALNLFKPECNQKYTTPFWIDLLLCQHFCSKIPTSSLTVTWSSHELLNCVHWVVTFQAYDWSIFGNSEL